MSVADPSVLDPPAPDPSAPSHPALGRSAVRRGWPSTRFLRSELRLIFGRRRNIAGLIGLAVVPAIIAIVVKVWHAGSGGTGGDFFGSITDNGLFVALAAYTLALPLLLPVGVATISADTIAGEANSGTLRYLLTVPVHRTRMLAVKYLAVVIFSFACSLVIAGTGMIFGLALFGGGSATSLSGSVLPFGSMLLRVMACACYIGVELSALGAVGMFVSSLTEQPIGGTLAVVGVVVACFVLSSIPQLHSLHPYLMTYHWSAFGELLRDPVTLRGPLLDGLLNAAAYIAIFWSAAWARFAGRDITS